MFRQHNEGYSLLYQVISDDSGVDKIFILKSADDGVTSLVKEVASVCQDAKKQMDNFPKSDNRIEYDVPDLPFIEKRSRDIQSHDDEKTLLTSSGKEFEVTLIFTQAQTMDYCKELAVSLAEQEDDPTRKAFLTKFAERCGNLHDRLMSLLVVKAATVGAA